MNNFHPNPTAPTSLLPDYSPEVLQEIGRAVAGALSTRGGLYRQGGLSVQLTSMQRDTHSDHRQTLRLELDVELLTLLEFTPSPPPFDGEPLDPLVWALCKIAEPEDNLHLSLRHFELDRLPTGEACLLRNGSLIVAFKLPTPWVVLGAARSTSKVGAALAFSTLVGKQLTHLVDLVSLNQLDCTLGDAPIVQGAETQNVWLLLGLPIRVMEASLPENYTLIPRLGISAMDDVSNYAHHIGAEPFRQAVEAAGGDYSRLADEDYAAFNGPEVGLRVNDAHAVANYRYCFGYRHDKWTTTGQFPSTGKERFLEL